MNNHKKEKSKKGEMTIERSHTTASTFILQNDIVALLTSVDLVDFN